MEQTDKQSTKNGFSKLKIPAQSSKIWPVVFVLAISLMGLLIYKSFASSPLVATIEAEQMNLPTGGSVLSDTAASGGKAINLTSNGTATGSVSFPSGVNSVTVSAKGTQCNGAPNMTVALDNTNLLTNTSVSAISWTNYTYTPSASIASGTHTLSVSFTNAYSYSGHGKKSSGGCTRSLYVDVTNFYGPNPPPTPAPVVALTANPLSVNPGQSSTLNWSASDATSCTASGAWSGSEPTTGSFPTGALNNTSTYRLDCSGPGGTGSNSVTVTVSSGLPLGALLFGDEFNGASGSQPAHDGGKSLPWDAKTYTTHSTMTWAGWDPAHISEDGNGNLVITATEDTAGNPGGNWHSGFISAAYRPYKGQRYIEARAKVACGAGTWSAPVWEWAAPWGSGGLENDVNEQLGRQPTQYNVTVHNWDASNKNVGYLVPSGSTQTLCNDFHTYGSAVYPDHIDYYLDGTKVQTISASAVGMTDFTAYSDVADIDLDMGGWGGTIAGNGPYSMLVDYIHVYQLN